MYSEIRMEPIYYRGWVIQPTFEGTFVYDRRDTATATVKKAFGNISEAAEYIDMEVRGSGN